MFRCRRCGACCRWPGAVKLRDGEAEAIARFLNMPEEEFFARHTVLTPDRQYLSLTETASGACEYLKEEPGGAAVCAIDPVKPQQCRDFPEKWNFPQWERKCAAGSGK